MTERTALEIADFLYLDYDAAGGVTEAADMLLRHQHAEIARLKAIAQRLRGALVGIVGADAKLELQTMTAFLCQVKSDDAKAAMCGAFALLDIRPEDIA